MDDASLSRIPERDEDRVVTPNFVTAVVDHDLEQGRVATVVTRFPPEPNGYLHIGHAKAICLDFGLAEDYRGRTNLRFDDTNPTTEDPAYVAAIKRDVEWLGFQWSEERYASDYFEQLYAFAVRLIEMGDAYVDSQSEAAIREGRGSVTEPGVESVYRNRSTEENLALFEQMREGEFEEGAHVLRAKIDMANANMVMRDPVLYRIRHAHHYRTGDAWHVYPLYDFAHPLSDAIEGVTHSLCTLEFVNNREIYDWLVERLFEPPHPHQYEFSRLSLDHTVVSKRKLLKLVQGGFVEGWDDPRMPTLAALRRRGYRPSAIRLFVNRLGFTKTNARTDLGLLEASVRDDLNHVAPRVMAVVDPVRLTIDGGTTHEFGTREASLWPHDVPNEGARPLSLGREVWIERSDVSVEAPRGWKRFAPGAVIRLRHGPVVHCDAIDVDDAGIVTSLRAHVIDPDVADRKVAGVVHWVDVATGVRAHFRLIDRLFADPDPELDEVDITEKINPASLVERHGYVEAYVAEADPDTRWQFERQGYFWQDPNARDGDCPVFVRIVTLKDGWAKREAAASGDSARTSRAATKPTLAATNTVAKEDTLDDEARLRMAQLEERGVARQDAARLAEHPDVAAWFTAGLAAPGIHDATMLANWTLNELPRALGTLPLAEAALTPEGFAELVDLVGNQTVRAAVAKELLPELLREGGSPKRVVMERNLGRLDDGDALSSAVTSVLEDHPDEVGSYLAGKHGLIGFFVGQVMRATQGRADPNAVRAAIEAALAERA